MNILDPPLSALFIQTTDLLFLADILAVFGTFHVYINQNRPKELTFSIPILFPGDIYFYNYLWSRPNIVQEMDCNMCILIEMWKKERKMEMIV